MPADLRDHDLTDGSVPAHHRTGGYSPRPLCCSTQPTRQANTQPDPFASRHPTSDLPAEYEFSVMSISAADCRAQIVS